MPKKSTEKQRRIKDIPERNTENLTIWPAGYKPATNAQVETEDRSKLRTGAESSYKLGPRPRSIEEIRKLHIKSKINKKIRGGRRQKILNNIEKLQEIINKCSSLEERIRFNTLLSKEKNNLNRLRKHKKINVT